MKKILSTITLISIFTLVFPQGEKYAINLKESYVSWHAEKVTGSHDGNINIKSGHLTMEKGELSGGSFEIDMTTITCSDINDQEWNAKLVRHLKSDDFFSVEKNPTAKLVITKVSELGDDRYNITAEMTIKNITKEIMFVAQISYTDGIYTGNADITIDRTKFDVRYGSGTFFDNLGDKTIYDNFDLKIKLVALKGSIKA